MKCEDYDKEYRRADAALTCESCVQGVISCPECNYCGSNQQENNFHASKEHVMSTEKF